MSYRHVQRNEATGPGQIRAMRGNNHASEAVARRLFRPPVAR
jgi:hypothetical protein